MSSALPEDVRRFILDTIDSVEQLEVLLLLCESAPAAWTAEALAKTLYSNSGSIARRLAGLQAKGLLAPGEPTSSLRYLPSTPELDATVTRLVDTYRQRRVAVITLIASKPMEKVRAFSDAFRLRKKDEEP